MYNVYVYQDQGIRWLFGLKSPLPHIFRYEINHIYVHHTCTSVDPDLILLSMDPNLILYQCIWIRFLIHGPGSNLLSMDPDPIFINGSGSDLSIYVINNIYLHH